MRWKIATAICGLILLACCGGSASAQVFMAQTVTSCGMAPSSRNAGVSYALLQDVNGNFCITGAVTGTFTATLGGFTPSTSGARGTPISVTTADSSGALPTGVVVVVSNVGTTNPMYCNVNGVAATTSDQYIAPSGGWFAFTIPSGITTLHCIATGGSTTANMVGGSGLPTGTGGGGGGGSSAINTWGGATLGAATAWGTPPTGNVIGANDNLASMGGTAIASGCTAALSGFSTSIPSIICPVMGIYVLNANANVANNADGVAAGATAGSPVVNYNYAFNGSTWDRLQDDANKNLKIAPQAFPAGGWTPKWFIAAASDNATNLKSTPGTVHAVEVYGIGSAPAYLKFYNKASSPTCGSDTIVKQIMIPAASTAANGAGSNAIVLDTAFSTGISYCVVTGIGPTDDTSTAASTFVVNIDWQ